MFTDTHCHVYHEYYENLNEIFENAKNNHVSRFFLAGSSQDSNEEVIETIDKYSFVYGCIGIHPEEVDHYQEENLCFLEQHFNDSKIIAIGEIGLDYHYTKENKEAQILLFRKQMELARKYHLPVVIHSREATEDTICVLKEYPDVKGVIHSFSGSLEVARIYLKMGYKLGINGVVTFQNSHLKEIIPEILEGIVLETDSPFLTPHPYRGKRNEPSYVWNIANFLCEISGKTLEEIAEITNRNIKEIFDKL